MSPEVKTRRELQSLVDQIVLAAEINFRLWWAANSATVDEDGDSNEIWLREAHATAQSFLKSLSRCIWD
jgi:hypothetical protein